MLGGVLRIVRTRTHVVMNLAAWTTRSGLAHLPEIIFATKAEDTIARCTHLMPEVLGVFVRRNFRVAFVNREPQPRRIECQNIDEQFPGQLDCVFFEIIAERKIPEHLEKRVVPGRFPNLVEIVVLTTGADTLLRRRSAHVLALLGAQKSVFE